MKQFLKLALAVGVPLAVLGVSGSASALSAPSATPPGGATPVTAPAGWPLLVDSTGAIQVNVPAEWTDVDLQPDDVFGDGTLSPRIKASTSIADFDASFDVSGIVFHQITATFTPEQLLADYVPGPCGAETTEPYDDGLFQGQLRHQTQCGQAGEYYTLAATTAARPGAVFVVEVGIASAAEVATVEGILSTFTIATGGATPSSAPPVTLPGVTAATGPTTSAMTQLVDDTGRLFVSVPSAWTQTNTAPADTGQGRLVASPDLTVFSPGLTIPSDYSVPGVYLLDTGSPVANPGESASFLPFEGCTEAPATPYADGTFTGSLVMQTCSGTSRLAVLVANRDDGSSGLMAVVLLTEPGDELLQQILASLDGDPTS